MDKPAGGVHRSIIVVDVENFGNPRRTNAHQIVIRDGLYRMLETALSRAGVPWEDCYREDRGDGALILAPPDISKTRLVDSLPHLLVGELRHHNALFGHEATIRLRMALHAGEVHYDDHGVTGRSINHAFRLLDAVEIKLALAQSRGLLAVVTSSWFYDEVVRHNAASNPEGYHSIQISVKETKENAWIYLPEQPYADITPGLPTREDHGDAQPQLRASSGTLSISDHKWKQFAIVDHEKLFGIGQTVQRIGRLLENQDGDWIISIFGSPGAGKTTLAYESVKQYAETSGFQRIAWVSAKLAQLTSLGNIEKMQRSIVDWKEILFDIVQQLNFRIDMNPMLIEQGLEQALASVVNVERCLIVIDNLETVQDAQFAVRYLAKEPIIRPHKVILTSRRSVVPFSGRIRELRWDGLTPQAAEDYTNYLLQDDPSIGLTSQDLDDLIEASECNPLLLKLIVRLAMFERQPINSIVSRLRNIHADLGENVASYLYAGSLGVLDSQVGTEAAVKLMNVFCSRTPGESFTNEEFYRLSRLPSRDIFDQAKAAACQLALVRALHNNTRFTIHSLLREFICSDSPRLLPEEPGSVD